MQLNITDKIRSFLNYKEPGTGTESYDSGYQEIFKNEGERKSRYIIDELNHLSEDEEIHLKEAVYLSIGGADGSELYSVLNETTIENGILLEYSDAGAEAAREKREKLAKAGKNLTIMTGDATQKLPELIAELSTLKKNRSLNTLVLSIQAVLHELPRRSPNFNLHDFFGRIFSVFENNIFFGREPSTPEQCQWPERVSIRIGDLPGEHLNNLADIINMALEIKASPSSIITDNFVTMDRMLAIETLHKALRCDDLKQFRHEIQEQLTSYSPFDTQAILSGLLNDSSVIVNLSTTDGFKKAWRAYDVVAKDMPGKPLTIPMTHATTIAISIKRPPTEKKSPDRETVKEASPGKAPAPSKDKFENTTIEAPRPLPETASTPSSLSVNEILRVLAEGYAKRKSETPLPAPVVGGVSLTKEEPLLLQGALEASADESVARMRERNESRERHINRNYSGEERILKVPELFEVAYTHRMWLFPEMEGGADPFDLIAEREEDPYSAQDALGIDRFKEIALNFRKNLGHKFPSPNETVSVCALEKNGSFKLKRSNYRDQFITNQKEIVDVKLDEIVKGESRIPPVKRNKTLRELNTTGDKRLLPFSESPLSNTIGIAATVVTDDGYLIVPIRNKKVHFQSGYAGCSTSGALVWNENLFGGNDTGRPNFMQELKRQLTLQEAAEEILLDSDKIDFQPLAFAREFERAGKPQFFFHIWIHLSLEQLLEEWKNTHQVQKEYDSVLWIKLYDFETHRNSPEDSVDEALDRILTLLLPHTYLKFNEEYEFVLSEEARANLFYLAMFLQTRRREAFPADWI